MAWSHDEALAAAQRRYDQVADVTVDDVTQEIDFDKISRTRPRRVWGSHLYAEIENFNRLLRAADVELSEMLRLLHILAREISKIVNTDFDCFKVHWQGPRVHTLAYRPVADETEMATKATLAMLAIKRTVAVFNDVLGLPADRQWYASASADHGIALATRSGTGGDQESLFLGSPANHAAKRLDATSVRLSRLASELLPQEFDPYLHDLDSDPDAVRVSMSVAALEELISDHGWTWTESATRARLDAGKISFPAGCVRVSTPTTAIDKTTLNISNTKNVWGISVFADMDGFTALVDDLVTDDPELVADDMIELVRAFHVLRGCMRDTAVSDFNALRIQYQGDRMQALCYQPLGDPAAVALRALELAAALKTTAEEIVPAVVAESAVKPLAIGLAGGDVLVSRMGEHSDQDVITVGASAADAAAIQQRLHAGQIGLHADTYALLPDWLRQDGVFAWSAEARAWVADNLDHERFTDLRASESTDPGLAATTGALGTAAVGPAAQLMTERRQPGRPLRPWANG